MPRVRVWIWRMQHSMGDEWRLGHVEIEVKGRLYGLVEKEGGQLLNPDAPTVFDRVFPGEVSPKAIRKLESQAKSLYENQLLDDGAELPPPAAVIYDVEVSDEQEQQLEAYLLLVSSNSNAPNYCPRPESLRAGLQADNCVTFAVGVLNRAKVLPALFSAPSRPRPERFYKAMEVVWEAGLLAARICVVLKDGKWVPDEEQVADTKGGEGHG